jgi:hypothetical protein
MILQSLLGWWESAATVTNLFKKDFGDFFFPFSVGTLVHCQTPLFREKVEFSPQPFLLQRNTRNQIQVAGAWDENLQCVSFVFWLWRVCLDLVMWGDGVVFNAKFCLFFLSRFFCRCRSHKLISYQQQIAHQEQEQEEVSQKGEMLGDSQPHLWLR